MQENDELDQVCVCLLPERLFAFSKDVVEQRRNSVRQRVGIQLVVERVIAPRPPEPDFDIVVFAAARPENLPDLMAEISLNLQHKPADSPQRVRCPIAED